MAQGLSLALPWEMPFCAPDDLGFDQPDLFPSLPIMGSEDMIEEEVAKNKAKRIECVNLNMKITNYETKQMAMEAKLKDSASDGEKAAATGAETSQLGNLQV